MHSNSRWLFEKYAKPAFQDGHRVLEIGPDSFPSSYEQLASKPHEPWELIDLFDRPHLTYRATTPYAYPIPDDRFDIVLSGSVMEHIPAPWTWIKEVARVCKPGGTVITIIPVSWPFHEYPVDCWRAYPDGMRALYAEAGLEVTTCVCESLEARRYPRHVPGRTPGWWMRSPLKLAYRLLGRLGLRVECAYDTITIGKKPPTST